VGFFIITLGLREVGFAASLVPVCQIQGSGLTSPRVKQAVRTQGVVTADFDAASAKGFFIQAENCDANPATSDGVFIYLGERLDVVSVGDLVEVSGTVVEYYGFTEINVAPSGVQVLAQGQVLPAAVELSPPYFYRGSDHDPVGVQYRILPNRIYLPLVAR